MNIALNRKDKMATRRKKTQKIELFYSYSHKDEDLRNKLEKHLTILKRRGIISDWHDRRIGAGAEWHDEIEKHVDSAKIILLLISADFLASDYCDSVEVKRAMKKQESGEARVIPIMLRPVDWKGSPFSKLQALPANARPITEWRNRDSAFSTITEGIRRIVDEFKPSKSKVSVKLKKRKTIKVIVVEDEKKWIEKIRVVLKAQKFKVETYQDYSEELIVRLSRNDYDLLITDIDLKKLEYSKDGVVLIKYALETNKNIPVIVVTGYPYNDVLEMMEPLLEAKIKHFIPKSKWDAAKFLKTVKTALRKGTKNHFKKSPLQ